MCSPIEIRVVISVSTYKKWPIIRADMKTAYLQSGPANRLVYATAPKESREKNFMWFLLAAAYGLVNSNE